MPLFTICDISLRCPQNVSVNIFSFWKCLFWVEAETGCFRAGIFKCKWVAAPCPLFQTRGLINKMLFRYHPKMCKYAQKIDVDLHFFRFIKPCVHQNLRKKSLYKSQSGEMCAYMHLHPDSSLQSPYMELTMPSFTMHNLIGISFPCSFPSTWHHV